MADDFLNFTSGDSAAAPQGGADFLSEPSAPSAPQDDFFGGAPATQAAPQDGFLAADATSQPPQDDFLGGQSQVQATGEVPQEVPQEGLQTETIAAESEPPQPAKPIEIPPLAKWEIANREAIAAKDSVAAAADSKIKKEAADNVSQFYAERNDLVTANHERNTGSESEFCKQRDALFATGQVWERVVSLIDVKASNEKKPQKVSRMRQLLLHMKNEAK